MTDRIVSGPCDPDWGEGSEGEERSRYVEGVKQSYSPEQWTRVYSPGGAVGHGSYIKGVSGGGGDGGLYAFSRGTPVISD